MSEDRVLLKAWQGGDDRAGRALVGRHYDSVVRFFSTKDEAHAPDLIQRTFLKLIEARARLAEDSNVCAYLLGIARHVLMDHYRAMYQTGERIDFSQRSVADLRPTPSSVIAKERQTQLLLQGLRRLPLDTQVLLELYFWEDLTALEIGRILQIPEGTVRTRLRRARQLLEQILGQLADSKEVLDNTLTNFDAWVAQVRKQLTPR